MVRKIGGLVLVLLVAVLAMGAGGPKQASGSRGDGWVGADPVGRDCNGNATDPKLCPYGFGGVNRCGDEFQIPRPLTSGEQLKKFFMKGPRECILLKDDVCQKQFIYSAQEDTATGCDKVFAK